MISEAVTRIKANPMDDTAWETALIGLAEARQLSAIEELLTARHQWRGDAASFGFHTLSRAPAGTGTWLAETALRDSAFRGIMLFLGGLDRAAAMDLDGCVPMIREGAFHCLQCHAHNVFSNDPDFEALSGFMLQQSALIEPKQYAPDKHLPPSDIATLAAFPSMEGPSPVLFAACDDLYLRTYVPRMVESMATNCPGFRLHLHVINPKDDLSDIGWQLKALHPGLGITCETGPAENAYYASCRFLVAARIQERLAAPMVLIDADTLFRPGADDLLHEAISHPISLIRNIGESVPSLIFSAALIGLGDIKAARLFLREVESYLRGKLAEASPPWTVDQAALFRAVVLAPIQPFDLGQHYKGRFSLPAFLTEPHELSMEARLQARTKGVSTLKVGFDAQRRPTFI